MRIEEFVSLTDGLPVIESEILCAGVPSPASLKVQLSRWKKAGKIIQLKRGIYVLAKTYRKVELYEPYVAGVLKKPSYISLEKALEHHGLIPESTYVYTSVTPKRPGRFATEMGTFDYRHVKEDLFWGYESVTVNGQTAFFASPEKALLDHFYLRQRNISEEYLAAMRLQNVERVDPEKFMGYAQRFKSPGMLRAAEVAGRYMSAYRKGEKTL